MRAKYATKERCIETGIYDGDSNSDTVLVYLIEQIGDAETLPSEFPRLDRYDADYIYITDLDDEVLIVNFDVRWKLNGIPREDTPWPRVIVDATCRDSSTMALEICQEDLVAPLALELSEKNPGFEYQYQLVSPRTNIEEAWKVFLTQVQAMTLIQYQRDITALGREWSPDSFPFRELTFALVSIASSQASFHHPAEQRQPRTCGVWDCKLNHFPRSPDWMRKQMDGDGVPMFEFGSMFHRRGELPGVSPTTTMYWLEGVLVSLTRLIDGSAISKAVSWGIKQGHTNFQIVILTLFEVAFLEVFFQAEEKPFVKIGGPINLSPLRVGHCASTNLGEEPGVGLGLEMQYQRSELLMTGETGTRKRLREHFPGLAALVNFFDVAANRFCAATKEAGILPSEVYDGILDFADYDTWKTCLLVSTQLRSRCLDKYRLNNGTRIVGGPFSRLLQRHDKKQRVLSFNIENMETGEIIRTMQVPCSGFPTPGLYWMPVIGSDQKALMSEVVVKFESTGEVPFEADSGDES